MGELDSRTASTCRFQTQKTSSDNLYRGRKISAELSHVCVVRAERVIPVQYRLNHSAERIEQSA
jgi:hypothetical protein